MNKFDPEIIRNYISEHESEICCVLAYYDNVCFTSVKAVYCNGNYVFNPDHLNERNPDGSVHIPFMQVIYNDGTIEILYAFKPEA